MDQFGRSGWIESNLPRDAAGNISVTMADVHIIIRTYNVCNSYIAVKRGMDPEFRSRLPRAADLFLSDWPYQVGIVALQEADEKADGHWFAPLSKLIGGDSTVANYLAGLFSAKGMVSDSMTEEELGLVWSRQEWELNRAPQVWKLPRRRINLIRWGNSYLSRTQLRHRTHGWILSVFNTHLAPNRPGHDPDVERRHTRQRQVSAMVQLIDTHVGVGELPPILVGDMNYEPASESYAEMTTRFELVNQTAYSALGLGDPGAVGIDHIWAGRRSHFSQTTGDLIPLRWHMSQGHPKGIDLHGISDHASPAASFRVLLPTQPPPVDFPTGAQVTVPDVLGAKRQPAERRIRDAGLRPRLSGSGPIVEELRPQSGTTVPRGSQVTLVCPPQGGIVRRLSRRLVSTLSGRERAKRRPTTP